MREGIPIGEIEPDQTEANNRETFQERHPEAKIQEPSEDEDRGSIATGAEDEKRRKPVIKIEFSRPVGKKKHFKTRLVMNGQDKRFLMDVGEVSEARLWHLADQCARFVEKTDYGDISRIPLIAEHLRSLIEKLFGVKVEIDTQSLRLDFRKISKEERRAEKSD